MRRRTNAFLYDLPNEILTEIFLFLPVLERLRSLALVCGKFNEIMQSQFMRIKYIDEILCFKNRMGFKAMEFLYLQAEYIYLNNSDQNNYNIPSLEVKLNNDIPSRILLKDMFKDKKCQIILKTTDQNEFKKELNQGLNKLSQEELAEKHAFFKKLCLVSGEILKKYKFFTAINYTNTNGGNTFNDLFPYLPAFQPLSNFQTRHHSFVERCNKMGLKLMNLFSLLLKKHPNVIFNITPPSSFQKIQKIEETIKNRTQPIEHLELVFSGMPNVENAIKLFKAFTNANVKLKSLSLQCKCSSNFAGSMCQGIMDFREDVKIFGLKAAKLLKNNKTLKSIDLQLCFKSLQQYKDLFAGIIECENLRELAFAFCLDPLYARDKFKKLNNPEYLVFKEFWWLLNNLKKEPSLLDIIFEGHAINFCLGSFMRYVVEMQMCFKVKKLYYDFVYLSKNNSELVMNCNIEFLKLLHKQNKVRTLYTDRLELVEQHIFPLLPKPCNYSIEGNKSNFWVRRRYYGKRRKYPLGDSAVVLRHAIPKVKSADALFSLSS